MWFFFSVALLGGLTAQSASTPNRIYRVGVDNNFPPYEFADLQGQAAGFNVEVLKAVAREIDIKVEFEAATWSSVIERFNSGKFDILSGMFYSEQREQQYHLTSPHSLLQSALFIRAGDTRKFDRLENYRIATQQSDLLTLRLKQRGLQPIEVEDPETALRLLNAGQVDAVYVARLVGLLALRKGQLSNIVISPHYSEPLRYCFAVKRSDFDLASKLNEGLAIIKYKGIYRQLYEKWFGVVDTESRKTRFYRLAVYFIAIPLIAVAFMFFWTTSLKRQVLQQTAQLNRQLAANEQARRELQDSENFFKTLFADNPDPVWLLDGFRIVDANRAACIAFGCRSRDELLSQTLLDLTPEVLSGGREPRLLAMDIIGRIAKEGVCRFEWEHRRLDGSFFPVEVTAWPVSLKGVPMTFSTWRDLSAKRAAENALKESERRLSMLMSNLPGMAYSCLDDRDWTMKFVSEGCRELLGYDPEELIGNRRLSFNDLIDPDYREAIWQQWQQVLKERGVFHCQYPIHTADQRKKWVWEQGRGAYDLSGKVIALEGFITDITRQKEAETERLELERQLHHAQKLESLGVLAGGIAHDFNNLLTSILGNLDLCRRKLPPGHPSGYGIEQAMLAGRRAAELTRQMLAYSGKGQFVTAKVDLNQVVAENSNLFRASIARNIELRQQPQLQLPPVVADPSQLQQVVMNLLTNAAEAIGNRPGGVITMSTGSRFFTGTELAASRLTEKPQPGSFVYLAIEDTGCGMSHETVERIFDPFFTTKFTGRGLGMAVVQGILRGHHGAIFVDSVVDRGTQITVLFPAATPAVSAEPAVIPPQNESAAPAGQAGLILVVDDEAMVGRLCCDIIEENGFATLFAADGQQGIDLFRANADSVCAVVLDLSMPVKDGLVTFNELRQLNDQVKIILTSGYNEQETFERFPGRKPDGFLHKPYVYEDIVALLRQLIPPASA